MYPRLNATITARLSQIGQYPSVDYRLIRQLHLSPEQFDGLIPLADVPIVSSEKNEQINEAMQNIAGSLTYNPLGDPAAIVERLRTVGRWISDRLLPSDCFRCCHNGFPRTVEILTDQNDIPWELTLVDSKFLSEQVILARYPFVSRGRLTTVAYATVPKMVIIIGKSLDLPNVDSEIEALKNAYSTSFLGEPVIVRGEAVTVANLRGILEKGDHGVPFDVVHFIGHGSASDKLVWLNLPAAPFLPDDVPPVILGNPLIFWNACFSATSALTRYQPDVLSDFGARLIANGASHFIGSLLPISDETATKFAQVFYTHLFAYCPVGEAFFGAKTELGTAMPMVHTYALYGNPTTRIRNHA